MSSLEGERATRVALVQAAASAVADQFVEIIPLPAFGMVFDAYFTGGAGASEFAPLYEIFATAEEIELQSGNALIDPPFGRRTGVRGAVCLHRAARSVGTRRDLLLRAPRSVA
jgi:hypothetical protein